MVKVWGKDDPWGHDPWVDRSAVLTNASQGPLGKLFVPSSTSPGYTLVSKAFRVGDRFVVVGSVVRDAYTSGQTFVSIFDASGAHSGTYLMFKAFGVSRLDCIEACPLPNGNFLLFQTTAGVVPYAHAQIVEMDLSGNIVRACMLSTAATLVAKGACPTSDPWVFAVAFLGVVGIFDARLFTMVAMVNNGASAFQATRSFYDPFTNSVVVVLANGGTTSRCYCMSLLQGLSQAAQYSSGGPAPTLGPLTNNAFPMGRWGDTYIFTASTGTQLCFSSGGWSRADILPYNQYNLVPETTFTLGTSGVSGIASTDKACYVMVVNYVAGGEHVILEILPNHMTGSISTSKMRAIRFTHGVTRQFSSSISAYGNDLCVTCNTHGSSNYAGICWYFNFDDVWREKGKYTVASTPFINTTTYASYTATVKCELWSLSFLQRTTATVNTPPTTITNTQTIGTTRVEPLAVGAGLYTRQAVESSVRPDLICVNFLDRVSI